MTSWRAFSDAGIRMVDSGNGLGEVAFGLWAMMMGPPNIGTLRLLLV